MEAHSPPVPIYDISNDIHCHSGHQYESQGGNVRTPNFQWNYVFSVTIIHGCVCLPSDTAAAAIDAFLLFNSDQQQEKCSTKKDLNIELFKEKRCAMRNKRG
jgi:hypothetical protein